MKEVNTPNPRHTFFEFDVKECVSEVAWARETAYKKAMHTKDTWQRRGACKRFTNLFHGDLAKNIFRRFIVFNRPDVAESLSEYDRVRDDGFRNNDVYDLMLICKGRQCSIEVKSSCEKYTNSIDEIYANRRLIINVDSVHSHRSCAYVQVMYVPANLNYFGGFKSEVQRRYDESVAAS